MAITAEIIADSISPSGVRITTFELDYPRIVHSELMTHREFSRNAASSRAIPTKDILARVVADPAMPVHFGKNQSGMQDAGEHFELINGYTPQEWWRLMATSAAKFSQGFADAGYHKQVANRGTEFAQNIKVVVTATSYDNWFHLRYDEMADPTINVLAMVMWSAYEASKPHQLLPGEWHVPYYFDGFWSCVDDETGLDAHGHTLDEALKISSSCSAQVSYRKSDDSLEKACALYERLVGAVKVHASPFEHQATPITQPTWTIELFNQSSNADGSFAWEEGVTHMNRYGEFCSGNFKGWRQHRQLIPNHVCTKYVHQQ